jgi:hypothetical protein
VERLIFIGDIPMIRDIPLSFDGLTCLETAKTLRRAEDRYWMRPYITKFYDHNMIAKLILGKKMFSFVKEFVNCWQSS